MQLNLYRHILETEYGMKVSAMFLGIAHPLRAGPLCLDVPRMEAELNSIVEVEGSKVFLRPQLLLLKLCRASLLLSRVSQRRRV